MKDYLTLNEVIDLTSGTSLTKRRLQQRLKELSYQYSDYVYKKSNIWYISRNYLTHMIHELFVRNRNKKRILNKYNIKVVQNDIQQSNTEAYLNKLNTINNVILKNDFNAFINMTYGRSYSVDAVKQDIEKLVDRLKSKGFDINIIYSIELNEDNDNHYHALVKCYNPSHTCKVNHKCKEMGSYTTEYNIKAYINHILQQKGNALVKDWDKQRNEESNNQYGISYILKQVDTFNTKDLRVNNIKVFDINRFGIL